MAVLIFVLVMIAVDMAAWVWGVDSRDWGRDPRSEGRPYRWI